MITIPTVWYKYYAPIFMQNVNSYIVCYTGIAIQTMHGGRTVKGPVLYFFNYRKLKQFIV